MSLTVRLVSVIRTYRGRMWHLRRQSLRAVTRDANREMSEMETLRLAKLIAQYGSAQASASDSVGLGPFQADRIIDAPLGLRVTGVTGIDASHQWRKTQYPIFAKPVSGSSVNVEFDLLGGPCLLIAGLYVAAAIRTMMYKVEANRCVIQINRIRRVASELCVTLGWPVPVLTVASMNGVANAHALRPRRQYKIRTTLALAELLDDQQLKAILAHEIGHFSDRRSRRISRIYLVSIMILGGVDGALVQPLWVAFATLPAMLLVIGSILRFFTRSEIDRRELLADEYATRVTGDPESLVSALELIQSHNKAWGRTHRARSILFKPLALGAHYPSLPKRIEAIRAVAITT